MPDDLPIVSIIVPTYNEEKDIRYALEALIRLDFPRREVIVVDDSTDSTPQIVDEYLSRGVQRLTQPTTEGRSGARNCGILHAIGDIVVILNADVQLPGDFIWRILAHYREGADYVLVESRVKNQESVFARFIDAEGQFYYGRDDTIEWTEGFSCRRSAIMSVGMFPTGFPTPIVAGEDGFVGQKLHTAGFKKFIDRSIVVQHIAPSRWDEFWVQQIGRGTGFSQTRLFLLRQRPLKILLRTIAKTILYVLRLVTVFPWVSKAWKISRFSSRQRADMWPFSVIVLTQTCANLIGEWQGLAPIFQLKIR